MKADLARRLAGEALGTALLLTVVVGSGVMGEKLAGGNAAIALLANALATGCALVVLISVIGPVSGAHFNPIVTGFFLARGEMRRGAALAYIAVQLLSAVAGVWLAHAMFDLPLLQISSHARDGLGQWIAEAVASFGLLMTILGGLRFAPSRVPMLVGLYITAAYWFTASTSFANPAVTLARSLTDSFAGIAPHSVPGFLCAQMVGLAAGLIVLPWLFAKDD